MQEVTPDIGYTFRPVYTSLWDTFIPALFQGVGEGTPGQGVTRLPAKQAGMDIPDLTKTATKNCKAPCAIIGHLVA